MSKHRRRHRKRDRLERAHQQIVDALAYPAGSIRVHIGGEVKDIVIDGVTLKEGDDVLVQGGNVSITLPANDLIKFGDLFIFMEYGDSFEDDDE